LSEIEPARLPEPPYSAVIFTSVRTDGDNGSRGAEGLGITVSYWRDEESIKAWRAQADHARARAAGRAR
jgi:heme-degrading monooxygenase HmoA